MERRWHSTGEIGTYLEGFRKSGVTNVRGKVIPGGHFGADESPQALCDALVDFRTPCGG